MGPILLFDKSLLQSIGLNSSVWLDNFFMSIICPVFYSETLADLEKNQAGRRDPKEEVQIIASKTPDMSSHPCTFHYEMVVSNLMGNHMHLRSQIPMSRGERFKEGTKTGVRFGIPPEAEAFNRWQAQEFEALEKSYAKAWRAMIKNLTFTEAISEIERFGIDWNAIKTLDDAKCFAHSIVSSKDRFWDKSRLYFLLLGINEEKLKKDILQNWSIMGEKSISEYAAYAAFVVEIEIFFHVAGKKSLISLERPSNKIDIAYLFYLPFCMVFSSSDKLHKACAPYFLRPDQQFVWGPDLKVDLDKINDFYMGLPAEEVEAGVHKFARKPPLGDDSIVTKIWWRYCSEWMSRHTDKMPKDLEQEKAIVDHVNRLSKIPAVSQAEDNSFPDSDVDQMVLIRRMRQKKGVWWQLPKSMKSEEE